MKKRITDFHFLNVDNIFSNIGEIHDIHEKFLVRLEERVASWNSESTLGDLFIELAPELTAYNTYGRNYEYSLETMTEYSKQDKFINLVKVIILSLFDIIDLELYYRVVMKPLMRNFHWNLY